MSPKTEDVITVLTYVLLLAVLAFLFITRGCS